MPTYDYVCAACGAAVEIFQSMSEAPKKKCPRCGKPKLERRIGAGAGFLFKGGGFHRTDYRSSSYKAGEKAEAGDESSAGSRETRQSAIRRSAIRRSEARHEKVRCQAARVGQERTAFERSQAGLEEEEAGFT